MMELPSLDQDEVRKILRHGLVWDEDEAIYLLEDIFARPETTTLVLGKRGSGKTAWAFRAMEIAHDIFGREAGTLFTKVEGWPKWDSILEVPRNTFLVIDEAELFLHSRRSMKEENVELSKILSIARHKKLTTVFVSQASNLIDKTIVQFADFIIFKEPLGLPSFERWELNMTSRFALFFFSLLPERERKEHYVTWSDEYRKYLMRKYAHYVPYFGLRYVERKTSMFAIIKAKNRLPSFWSEEISTSFSSYGREEDPTLEKLRAMGSFSVKDMMRELEIPKSSAYYLLKQLMKRGKVERIRRGIYRVV